MKTMQVPDLKDPILKTANPKTEHQELLTFVLGRFQDMKAQRQTEDKYWPVRQKQMDAIYR